MKTILIASITTIAFSIGALHAETVVSNPEGRLSVRFCRDNLVHFRYAPNGTEFVPEDTYVLRQAIEKKDSDYAPVSVKESRSSGSVSLAGERLKVSVDSKTLGISITADGREVFRSAAEAFASNGEGRTARFVRDVACEESFMGLGNIPGTDFKSLELRDRTYDLWLTANNVHAIIPLWYSSAGYGVYLCNSNRGRISFKNDYNVSLEGGEMNFYFVWGPSFKDIIITWSELAGRMHMPPLYAMGLTYRGAGGFSAKDLESVTREQQEAGIAVDVIGVEPGWHTKAYPCSFRWSDKFKDPKGFLDTMHGLGVKVNFWEHPYYSPDCPIVKESEPYGRWGLEIAKAEGSNSRYGFGGFVPDMTMKGARDLYWKLHEDVLFNIGADGLKVDETDDWAVGRSLSEKMPSGISCNAYHNLIGTLTCNFVHERCRDVYGKRTFHFSRGNWAGMQRWATSAYTDFYGFEQFVMSVIVQSCSGSYYTPEIRNRETPSDVAYMRRAQMMFLTPFPMSNEWQENAVVTRRSKAVFDCYKKYNALHYSLVPYLYSLFREQNKTGVCVVRALPFEFGGDQSVYGISDEFMLGPSLLVRPVADFRRSVAAKVYLPKGADWIDWWTHAKYDGGEETLYPAPADVMPIFVRRGSIIPMGHYGRSTSDLASPDLDILVVPSETETTFTIYEDDGISFDYERGVYRETDVTAIARGDTVTVKIAKPKGSYKTPARNFNVRILHNGRVEERRVKDDGTAHSVSVKMGPEKKIARPVLARDGKLYECEAEGNQFEKAEVNGGKNGASYNVNSPAAGPFLLTVECANVSDKWQRLKLSVNGKESLFNVEPTGSDQVARQLQEMIYLKAGDNRVEIYTTEGDKRALRIGAVAVK